MDRALVLLALAISASACGAEQPAAQVVTLPTPLAPASSASSSGVEARANDADAGQAEPEQAEIDPRSASGDPTPTWGSRIQLTPDGGAHRGVPTLRIGDPSAPVVGLPREIIQRVVRMSAGRFRRCYEAGLARDPSLEGRVSVELVIDAAGAVTRANAAASTTLRDPDVVRCVVQSFLHLAFPAPAGGVAIVVQYPIQLSP
jgi:hypothetical protein